MFRLALARLVLAYRVKRRTPLGHVDEDCLAFTPGATLDSANLKITLCTMQQRFGILPAVVDEARSCVDVGD